MAVSHDQVRSLVAASTRDDAASAVQSHTYMSATTIHDLSDWRSRLAHALAASFRAMDERAPAANIARLQERIRTLEDEGRERGFLPRDGAHG